MNLLNFRDLGGLITSDGRKVRLKRLLRAALPAGLSAEEIAFLRECNLKFIVDFRTQHEVESLPCDTIEGVTYTHIDIMGENAAQAADPKYWMKIFHEDPASVAGEFTKTYQEFATSPSSMAGYSAFIKALAASEGATLFHCAAGKDRTGFAAAIILRLLGVPDEQIFEDYMKTIVYQEQVSGEYESRAKARGFSDKQIKEMGDIFIVNTDYLHAAFNAAEGVFGSFEGYVKNGLAISNGEIERLKEIYLE